MADDPAPLTGVQVFAPAKINLALHVTGQRDDGYHLLDSLVMLAGVGDQMKVSKSETNRLTVIGPMSAGVPNGPENLVLRAAALMGVTADITLDKQLPNAAGVGGGSSDAAACMRALGKLYNLPLPGLDAQLSLGADVPVCMTNMLTRVQGIGEQITEVDHSPSWPMILVNPGVSLPTVAVFGRLSRKDNAAMPDDFPAFDWSDDVQIDWIARQRNDLEAPALALAPQIGKVLDALRMSSGCILARMSGSGTTCFAIMLDDDFRDDAVAQLRRDHPKWWIMPTAGCGVEFK